MSVRPFVAERRFGEVLTPPSKLPDTLLSSAFGCRLYLIETDNEADFICTKKKKILLAEAADVSEKAAVYSPELLTHHK